MHQKAMMKYVGRELRVDLLYREVYVRTYVGVSLYVNLSFYLRYAALL